MSGGQPEGESGDRRVPRARGVARDGSGRPGPPHTVRGVGEQPVGTQRHHHGPGARGGQSGRAHRRVLDAGDGGEFVDVRLHDVGPLGERRQQGLAVRVQQGGHPRGTGQGDEHAVGVRGYARRQAAGEDDRPCAAQQFAVPASEPRPLGGGHRGSGLQQDRGVTVVDDGDGTTAFPVDRDEVVGDARCGEVGAHGGAGRAPGESGHGGPLAESAQDTGHVDALSAGPLADGGDAVARVRTEPGDAVGDVEGGVEGDGEDHCCSLGGWPES